MGKRKPFYLFVPAVLLALGILALPAAAQGCGGVTKIEASTFGKGCPGAGAKPPYLEASLLKGTSSCSLQVEIKAVRWFPNVYFTGWILLVGTHKISFPVIRPGCTLLVFPLGAFAYDRKTTRVSFPLPNDPALLGATVLFQGAAKYVGFYFGPDLTAGLAVTFK